MLTQTQMFDSLNAFFRVQGRKGEPADFLIWMERFEAETSPPLSYLQFDVRTPDQRLQVHLSFSLYLFFLSLSHTQTHTHCHFSTFLSPQLEPARQLASHLYTYGHLKELRLGGSLYPEESDAVVDVILRSLSLHRSLVSIDLSNNELSEISRSASFSLSLSLSLPLSYTRAHSLFSLSFSLIFSLTLSLSLFHIHSHRFFPQRPLGGPSRPFGDRSFTQQFPIHSRGRHDTSAPTHTRSEKEQDRTLTCPLCPFKVSLTDHRERHG